MTKERTIPTPAPSDRPGATILIKGKELGREYHVLSIVVTKQINRIASAKVVLLDGEPSKEDFELSNTELFVPGNTIEIQAGYHSQESTIFQGIVICHGIKTRPGKPALLSVECKHPAVIMTTVRKNAYHHDVTDSDVFERIIGDYSILTDVDATSVKHPGLVQYESTDWDFIVSRADVNSRLVFTNHDKVEIKKPDFTPKPVLTLIYGATMLEFEAHIDARDQVGNVAGRSWNCAKQELTNSDGKEASVKKQGNIEPGQLAQVVSNEPVLSHGGRIPDQELQSWTDAKVLKSRMAKIQGRVKCIGSSDVYPGVIIELNGVGDRFNGPAYVSGVRHEIQGGIWTTDAQFGWSQPWFAEENQVSVEPAANLVPAVNGLHIGVVVQLQDDPDGEERIQVKMPMIDNNDQGIWTRIATLDAGQERGICFRPEIGDEVILGFINDDPRDPVMLGMLHSSAKAAPLPASDDNHEKGIITRSGMKQVFNDEKKSITLETPAGKRLVIDEDQGVIDIEDENGNKVELSADGILLESSADLVIKAAGDVTIEGTNLTNSANAEFKATGTAGAELSTSSSAVIKGSIVQIN
jgi:Rhs element Vgr protein